MHISSSIVNGPKSNNLAMVGIWVIVASRNHLTTFCRPFVYYAVRMFNKEK